MVSTVALQLLMEAAEPLTRASENSPSPTSPSDLANACLELLNARGSPETGADDTHLNNASPEYKYAAHNWHIHLCNSNLTEELRGTVVRFCETNLEDWFRNWQVLSDPSDPDSDTILSFDQEVTSGLDAPGRLHHFTATYTEDSIIDTMLSIQSVAVILAHDGDPNMARYLRGQGHLYVRRFRLGKIRTDLESAIECGRRSLGALTKDATSSDRSNSLDDLAKALHMRFEFEKTNLLNDLEEAIKLYQEALELRVEHHPDRPTSLVNLGNLLFRRFQRIADVSDINTSISLLEDGLQLTPGQHPHKSSRFSILGDAYWYRFQLLRDIGDINKSIMMKEDAVRLAPEGHPDKPSRLNNLGNSLFRRFERLGDLDDINKSIMMFQDAVRLTPEGHPDKPSRLNNLGNLLSHRFERLGDLDDINKSIMMFEGAVRLTPEGHPNKPSWLNNLGNSLSRRFERLGDLDDINKSIMMFEGAVRLTPEGHPNKPSWLNNLGNSLSHRFERLGDLDDINKSIMMFEDAVRLTPEGHPDKPARLNNLGNSLFRHFERLGDLDDINKSIMMFEDAVRLTPEGHPDKPSRLNNLGSSLFRRFEQFHDPSDLDAAIHQFSSAASSDVGSTSVRFQASSQWARCSHLSENHSPLDAYALSLQLLPELAWLGLSIPDRHHHLLKAGVVVRDAVAAAVAVQEYLTAIEWLEQGRSVVWGQLLQLRSPIDDLRDKYPSLANDLEHLSRQLEESGSRGDLITPDLDQQNSLEASATHYHNLARERGQLLQTIRYLPGFDRFMLPKKFSDIIPATRHGPIIVVNVSKARCDALILLPDHNDVLHIPLKEFTYDAAVVLQKLLYAVLKHKNKLRPDRLHAQLVSTSSGSTNPEQAFETILSQLWLRVVRPILDGMDITAPSTDKSLRVWWFLTGPLAFLPIHAAGLYGENELSTIGPKLADYVVSSYTPTLTALIDGVRPRAQSKPKVLAVALPLESHLPSVQTEVDNIGNYGPVSKLLETEATVKNVVEGMKEANWVHFACHGIQDISNPTKNALLLAGGARLTLSEISKLSLPNAELVYLSACQTATGAEDLSEEAVHLTAGMLLAGYRGVVGIMWSIMDSDAPKVADAVYAELFKDPHQDPSLTAFALQEAVKKLCNKSTEKKPFLSWVPYIHVGL